MLVFILSTAFVFQQHFRMVEEKLCFQMLFLTCLFY